VKSDELVEFANCKDTVEAVQRYIGRFGPPFLFSNPKDGIIYAALLGIWKGQQLQFCMTWDRMIGIEVKNEFTERFGRDFPERWKAQPPQKAVEAKGEFRLIDRKPVFVAENHYMALVAKLLTMAGTGKLRKCLHPDCVVTPYFIADHRKTQYCSEDCARWGQRQAKKKYWHERLADRPDPGKGNAQNTKKEEK
jgi:hypothetical protein